MALRVNYVGELGWELHVPLQQLVPVYDALWQAGEAHGIRDFGVYAMDSLRLEKGYRGWKGDITREYTPLMAGLDRFVALDKGDFTGRAALLAGARDRAEGAPGAARADGARRVRRAVLLHRVAGRHARRHRGHFRLWPPCRPKPVARLCPAGAG